MRLFVKTILLGLALLTLGLTSASARYDAVGNVTSSSASGTPTPLTWDAYNRLVQVGTGGTTWVATYDGLGRRVRSKDSGFPFAVTY